MEKIFTTHFITRIALLSVLSFALHIFRFALPIFPVFLEIDISDVPALIGAITLGPLAGVLIEIFKNLLNLIINSSTGGIGELANFMVGMSLVLPFALIYRKISNLKGYIFASVISVIIMSIFAGILNYYILLPLYTWMYGISLDEYVKMGAEFNNNIKDIKTFIVLSIIPFNILKGFLNVLLTYFLYKTLKPVLNSLYV